MAFSPATVSGVAIVTDTVTTRDFSLQTAPSYTISGTITEEGTAMPLLAEVVFDGSPVVVWSDPFTGHYQAELPLGEYTMRVNADGHRPQERLVVVDRDQTQHFILQPLPCILLVDDDNNIPDVRPLYATALGQLGYDYDVFDVGGGSGDGPSLEQMQGYRIITWFSGDKYGGGSSAGPNSADESSLAAYLDTGGMLFLSSQDYLYDMGSTTFGQNYLGVGTFTNDSGNASTKYGVPGDPIGGGLGPYPLSYPTSFSDYGDIVSPAAGASLAFRDSATGGNGLDQDKDGGDWRTVFFATSWVPVYNYSAANGEQVLERVIEWLGGCAPGDGTLSGQVTNSATAAPLPDVQVTAVATGTGVVQALTNPAGQYTMTLPAGVHDVTAAKTGYLSHTITGVMVYAGDATLQSFGLQPVPVVSASPLSITAEIRVNTLITRTLWLTNSGAADLDFYLHELSPTLGYRAWFWSAEGLHSVDLPWLAVSPISGTLPPGESLTITLTADATGLVEGFFRGRLDIESNDPQTPHLVASIGVRVRPFWLYMPILMRNSGP